MLTQDALLGWPPGEVTQAPHKTPWLPAQETRLPLMVSGILQAAARGDTDRVTLTENLRDSL